MDVDTATLAKWLQDLETADRYHMESYNMAFANAQQTAASNAVRETLAQMKKDIRDYLNG